MQNRILILATSSALTLRGGFWTEGYDPLSFEPHWHDTNLVLVNAGLPHGPQEPGFRLTVMTPRTAKIRGSPDDRRTTRDSTDSAAPPDDRSAEVGTSPSWVPSARVEPAYSTGRMLLSFSGVWAFDDEHRGRKLGFSHCSRYASRMRQSWASKRHGCRCVLDRASDQKHRLVIVLLAET